MSEVELFRKSDVFDYKLCKPIDYDLLNEIVEILIEKIRNNEKRNIQVKAEQILKDVEGCPIKQKAFLKDLISTLIVDDELQGGIYETLSRELGKEQSTIRQHLKRIIDSININTFISKFGFVDRPKNVEFLNRLKEMIKDNNSEDNDDSEDFKRIVNK